MKNGFTLVELLGVIIIIGVLSLIVTISTSSVINNSKNELTEIQIRNIESAAQTYYLKEGMNDSNFDEEEINECVNVSYLLENGYIEGSEIPNPENNSELLGSVKISYKSNQYTYKYEESLCPSSE